ncbi:hypothetical protein [Sphingomonas sp. ID0503]|uniref:hypothetical protein n=1 Tax=Sphingomonas sp. ID0503 TaxID=3399691 RepID=UPI003AFB611C
MSLAARPAPPRAFFSGDPVNLRFIDWIWHVRGNMPLAPDQSGDEALSRLEPLFRERGTSHERAGDTLTFRKDNQAPQDRMSVFDGGTLRVEPGATGTVLRYDLFSRMLLFCFLAPFMFLAFAQFATVLNKLDKPAAEAAKSKTEKDKKDVVLPQSPIDKFLGAPAPEKPDKDKKKKKDEEKKEKHATTPAYVFAAIFASLYLVGRILEDWLVRRLFRRKLLEG